MDREEAITQSVKGLVTSPFGKIEVPIQEFKRLLTLAGEAAHNHLANGDPLEDGLLVSKWRARIVQMGAP